MTVKHPLSVVIAVLGAAYMAAAAFDLWPGNSQYPFIGSRLYDIYAHMLLAGRMDLPLRELNIEGHYTPDGRGYMYHGLGPLLTRLPFLPFVNLPTTWLAPLSIWFWAVLGNTCCHRAFVLASNKAAIPTTGAGSWLRTVLALGIWFASPGVLLTANGSVFYEPIAMAYGLSCAFILLIAMASFGSLLLEKALPWLALVAGLSVHARPHVAVGLYLGVCLIAFVAVRRSGRRAWRSAGLAMVLLGLFGGLLLAFNAARFHNPGLMHGSFEKSELQYGFAYWGFEDPGQGRARAFEEHGRLNLGRLPPNLLFYAVAPLRTEATNAAVQSLQDVENYFPAAAFIRVEEPRAGVIFLWPMFMLLMILGLRQREIWRMPGVAGLAAVSTAAVLMLSYATISLRYHIDLWPAIALPALFGVGPLATMVSGPGRSGGVLKLAIPLLLLAGMTVTGVLVVLSHDRLRDEPGGIPQRWTHAFCLEQTGKHGFSDAKGRELCRVSFDIK